MSVKVLLESQVKVDRVDALMAFLIENLPNVRGFKGCMNVTVYFNQETNTMVFHEEWLSVADHRNYIAFIDKNGVLGSLASYLAAPPDIKYFSKLEM